MTYAYSPNADLLLERQVPDVDLTHAEIVLRSLPQDWDDVQLRPEFCEGAYSGMVMVFRQNGRYVAILLAEIASCLNPDLRSALLRQVNRAFEHAEHKTAGCA